VFAITEKLMPEDPRLSWLFRYFRLETGLAIGAVMITAGVGLAAYSLFLWDAHHFGPMDPVRLVRVVASTMLLFTMGVEICLASFFLSILGLSRR
jgi:hypothetical protein